MGIGDIYSLLLGLCRSSSPRKDKGSSVDQTDGLLTRSNEAMHFVSLNDSIAFLRHPERGTCRRRLWFSTRASILTGPCPKNTR